MTAIPLDTEVLVAGGGPAGVSTAVHLARLGHEVTIVDRARFPRSKPCAEYLSPEAGRVLTALGAMPAIHAADPARLRGMIVHSPGGHTMRGDFDGSRPWRGWSDHGLALPRRTLDAILIDRARAAGVRIIERARIGDLRRAPGGAVTGVHAETLEGTREIGARLVIGADGLRSVVARRLGLARVARWPRRIALVAHYRGVEGMTDCGEMHVDRHGYVGLARVGRDLVNVALVVPARIARRWPPDKVAMLEGWIRATPSLARRFARAERVEEVRATGPFASHARRAWAPGAALVGDAADFYDPFTGEGIYAALAGGEFLAPYADAALRAASPALAARALAGYEHERRRRFRGKWTVERLVAIAVAWPLLLDRVTRVLGSRKDLADLFVGVTGDFVPPREVLRPSYLARLLLPA